LSQINEFFMHARHADSSRVYKIGCESLINLSKIGQIKNSVPLDNLKLSEKRKKL